MNNRRTQWWRRRKTSLTKYLPLTLFVSFERVVQSLHVRGSWRPNITEIFWPRSYGRQHCVFLVLHGCSTGTLESTLLGAGFPYYISSLPLQLYSPIHWLVELNCPAFYLIRRRSGCVTIASLEWPVWSSSSGNNCHTVQRSLSSDASVYESIMEFLIPRPISSANFRPHDFLS